MSLGDLFAENLTSDKVFSHEDQLHLIEDELHLFSNLEGAVSLDLDLLDDISTLLSFTIFFEILAHAHSQ